MNNYYQSEFKKAFYSRKLLISITFSFICLCIGGIEYLSGYITSTTGSFYLFTESYSSGFYSMLIYLSPIICSIPFALSYLDEKKSNTFEIIVEEIGLKKYIKRKLLVNMICGGLTLSVSLVLYYIFLILIRGISPNDMTYYELNQHLGSIISNSQLSYIIIEVLFSFIFGATFSNFTFCMSFILNDKYLSIFSSLFFHMLSAVVLSRFSIYLNSQIIYSFSLSPDIDIVPRILYAFILNLICIIIITLSYKIKNISINIKSSFKIISYLSLLLLIYIKVDEFLLFHNNQGSIFEFLIYLSNDIYTVSYFISFCFLFVYSNLFIKNSLTNSLLYDLKSILIAISKFMIIFISFGIFMSILKLSFNTNWSDFNKSNGLFIGIYKTYSPIFVLFISLIHMFLYLLAISLIGITTMRISKNKTIGLVATSTVIIFNICTSIGRIPFLNKISLSRHADSTFSLSSQGGYLYFLPSLVYWLCLIFIICNIYLDYSNITIHFKSKKISSQSISN